MASVITSRRPQDPTRLEIEARKAEIHALQQASIDAMLSEHSMLMADCYEEARITGADPVRLMFEANAELLQHDENEPTDLDHRDPRQTEQWLPVPAFDDGELLDPDDCELGSGEMYRRLNRLAEDADARGVLNYYNINRGSQAPYHERGFDGRQEMSKADRCNVELRSLWLLNQIPDCDDEHWTVGDVDPTTDDVSDAATYERMVENAKPIPMVLKTEVPPFKSATAFAKPKRLPRVVTDVRSFRSKRK